MQSRSRFLEVDFPVADLYRERREERTRLLKSCRRQAACMVGLAVGASMLLGPLTVQALRVRSDLRRATTQRSKVDEEVRRIEQTGTGLNAITARYQRLEKSRNQRLAWERMLAQIGNATPSSVWLERLQMKDGPERGSLTLSGSADSMSVLQGFIAALFRTPGITKVSLTETASDPLAGTTGLKFSLAIVGNSALSREDSDKGH